MAFKLSFELVDATKGSGDAICKREETYRMEIELYRWICVSFLLRRSRCVTPLRRAARSWVCSVFVPVLNRYHQPLKGKYPRTNTQDDGRCIEQLQ
ncbi:hypothetical protein L1987_18676 [Smallanthus sonchifolius]|uniref:Uncharacterized protein n=1 Tax=Smallanthus sonchifolius TaxID=185202 RepID=A0ACB9J2G2_9ASTR|nr:hypothetical protein L1987_18676 [Smallanthus sonchifolius]